MLNPEQVKKAAKALLVYAERQQEENPNQLFNEDSYISLAITMKKIPDRATVKPQLIPLEHSLHSENSALCLITKDPQKEWKEKIQKEPIPGLEKIIGLSKLRGKHSPYKERRKLMQAYDLFLADERIVTMMPAYLGAKFFEKKKQPMPVCLTGKSFKDAVERVRDSALFFLPTGSELMVKIARTSFSTEQVVANIMGAIDHVVEKIPKKWKNVQAVSLRTHDSPALPIFSSLPAEQKIDMSRGTVKGAAKPPAPERKKRKRPLAEKKVAQVEPKKAEAEAEAEAVPATPAPVKKKKKAVTELKKKKPAGKKKSVKKAPASARKAKA